MAYLSISDVTQVGCIWAIGGLSNSFDSAHYSECGVTTMPFSDGATSIGGIVDCVTPAQTSNPSAKID